MQMEYNAQTIEYYYANLTHDAAYLCFMWAREFTSDAESNGG